MNKEEKSLFLCNDVDCKSKVAEYLARRYNLAIFPVEGVLELLSRIGADDFAEFVILDERVAGLAATSHAYKNIKDQCENMAVMYLETLQEIMHPRLSTKSLKVPRKYATEEYREEETLDRMGRQLAIFGAVLESKSLDDLYYGMCDTLKKVFAVDNAVFVVLRMDEKPIVRGMAFEDLLQGDEQPAYEVLLQGSEHWKNLVEYYKPVHIPDLNDEPLFRKELQQKFSLLYKSALLLPLQIAGQCLGFIGLFTQRKTRLYSFFELESALRAADLAASAMVYLFAMENEHLQIDWPDGEAPTTLFATDHYR